MNAFCGICGEFCARVGAVAVDRLDEPEGAHRLKVLAVLVARIVFSDDMPDKPQIVDYESLASGVVAVGHGGKALLLLPLGERRREGARGGYTEGGMDDL